MISTHGANALTTPSGSPLHSRAVKFYLKYLIVL